MTAVNTEALTRLLQYCTPEERTQLGSLLSSARSPWVSQVPHPRQALFLELREEREVFYGGAAGGGKSSTLLMAALEYVDVPGYSALLLRRTYADLSKPGALMDRAHQWLRGTGAKWNEQKKQWTFPSGAILTFGYLETDADKYQYQGAEYQFIGFDELTQFKESSYTYLFSRLRRLKDSDVPLRMRSASNPGGTGAEWVHRRFVPEGFTPEQARQQTVFFKEDADESGRVTRRAFIPATLDDNPSLDRVEYAESLQELDPVTREQLLRGDWQIKQRGDILSMWNEPHHVISWSEFARVFGSRHIPPHWLLGVYQDAGTTEAHPCVTSWFATAPQNAPPSAGGVVMAGSVYLYRALTVFDWTTRQVAEEMKRLMEPHVESERVRQWQMSHEASSERMAYAREHDLPFWPWPTGRTRGVAQLRGALEIVERERPHPFKPGLMGHPKLYHVVDDDQLLNPRDDRGLARHRAEIPAYHWATTKSGEEMAQLVPHALFNDAVDTERAAAADYFPISKARSEAEEAELALPENLRMSTIQNLPSIEEQHRAANARDFALRLARSDEQESDGNRYPLSGRRRWTRRWTRGS